MFRFTCTVQSKEIYWETLRQILPVEQNFFRPKRDLTKISRHNQGLQSKNVFGMIMVFRITVVIVVNRFGTSSFGTALGWLLLSTFLSTILEVTQFGWYQQTIFNIWSAVAGMKNWPGYFSQSERTNILNDYLYCISGDRVANQSTRKTLSTVLVPRCVSLDVTLRSKKITSLLFPSCGSLHFVTRN